MTQIKPLNEKTLTELNVELESKQKAANDLNLWLSKHDSKEPEYRRVMADRKDLENDMVLLKHEIFKRNKPIARSLNESFEL